MVFSAAYMDVKHEGGKGAFEVKLRDGASPDTFKTEHLSENTTAFW
jgi:hypothetical protein